MFSMCLLGFYPGYSGFLPQLRSTRSTGDSNRPWSQSKCSVCVLEYPSSQIMIGWMALETVKATAFDLQTFINSVQLDPHLLPCKKPAHSLHLSTSILNPLICHPWVRTVSSWTEHCKHWKALDGSKLRFRPEQRCWWASGALPVSDRPLWRVSKQHFPGKYPVNLGLELLCCRPNRLVVRRPVAPSVAHSDQTGEVIKRPDVQPRSTKS